MKNKPMNENHNIALGTTIIIIVLVIVFSTVFGWMYSMDMLFLPDFFEQVFGIGDDSDELPWDLGALSEIVKNGKDSEGEALTFEVTYENLLAALLLAEREEGVRLTGEIEYFVDDASYSRKLIYSRDENRFRVELFETLPSSSTAEPISETLKIGDENSLYVLDCESGEYRVIARDGNTVPENEAGIPSVDALLDVVKTFPGAELGESADEADSADAIKITDTVIKLVRTESENVYYISYTYPDLDLTEEYYVSLLHRMIISATAKQSGKTVYSYNTTSFSADPDEYGRDELYDFSESAEQEES